MKFIREIPTDKGMAHEVIYHKGDMIFTQYFGPEIPRAEIEKWKPKGKLNDKIKRS